MEFIDRTILEILSLNPKTDFDYIQRYVKYAKVLGMNIMEIDVGKFHSAARYVNSGNVLLRIDKVESIQGIQIDDLYGILLPYDSLRKIWNVKKNGNYINELRNIALKNKRCFIEINAETIEEFIEILSTEDSYLNSILDNLNIYCIRVKGLSLSVPFDLQENLHVINEYYQVKIDICAENAYNCATAAAVEAASAGAAYITATFCGFGVYSGFAALEEVLLALKVIRGMELKADTKVLPDLKKLFESMTGTNISAQKPVLGESIFMCESGIHVDGILKEPSSYEPYPPELIGQTRKIILGKHTGKAAVLSKLAELNLKLNGADINDVVDEVRRLSIENDGRFETKHLQQVISSAFLGGV